MLATAIVILRNPDFILLFSFCGPYAASHHYILRLMPNEDIPPRQAGYRASSGRIRINMFRSWRSKNMHRVSSRTSPRDQGVRLGVYSTLLRTEAQGEAIQAFSCILDIQLTEPPAVPVQRREAIVRM